MCEKNNLMDYRIFSYNMYVWQRGANVLCGGADRGY